jgi:hypothetical protein
MSLSGITKEIVVERYCVKIDVGGRVTYAANTNAIANLPSQVRIHLNCDGAGTRCPIIS